MSEELEIEPQEPPQEPQAPAEEPTQSALQAQLAELKQQQEALRKENTQLNQAYNALAMTALAAGDRSSRSAPEERPAPDRDEDPDGYIQHMVQKQLDERLKKELQPVVQQYRSDRDTLFARDAETARFIMRADKERFPDFDKLESEVMEYARLFPAEQLARPGALEECYYRVAGKHAAAERSKALREERAQLETAGRQTPSSEPARLAPRKLTDKEVFFAQMHGLDDKQFRALQGGGRMDIDEWQKLQEKPKKAS